MSRQNNSDPLPYVQVDRAVKPKAALLANALGVSTQHALGSLVEWWELCGDPRELETIVAATREGEEPEVVLDGADASLRFKLASGKDVEPVVLVRLGLLEQRPDGFRVRGMSRYFAPIAERIESRARAVKGGKASAESRRKASGTAQPSGGRGSVPGSEGSSDPVRTASEPPPNREPNRDGTATEAQPNPIGQRSAVSGQRASKEEEAPSPEEPAVAAFHIEPPDIGAIDSWSKEDFWKAAELTRRKWGFPPQKWPNPITLSKWWGEARAEAEVRELALAFQDFAKAKHWREAKPPAPFAGFMSQWNNFLPRRAS